MGYSNNEKDPNLGRGKIAPENVSHRSDPTHHADVEPPDNPAAHPNMKMEHKSLPLGAMRAGGVGYLQS